MLSAGWATRPRPRSLNSNPIDVVIEELMARCKWCGEWAGVASSEHDDCSKLAAKGSTIEQIKQTRRELGLPQSQPSASSRPLTTMNIFWSVFFALWAFALTAGAVAEIIRMFTS